MASHYVDNKKLFEELVKHRAAVAQQPDNPPAIPEYIGECLLMIATRLSNKPNFASYTFRDDMISDAIENCILYMHNFNPEKSQNPFAYFTQITHYAFIRRIEREKKYVYTKYKYALHKTRAGEDHAAIAGESYDLKDPTWASYENIHEFISNYEDKITKNRAARVADDDDDLATFDILEEEISSELEPEADGFVENEEETEE